MRLAKELLLYDVDSNERWCFQTVSSACGFYAAPLLSVDMIPGRDGVENLVYISKSIRENHDDSIIIVLNDECSNTRKVTPRISKRLF